MNIIWLFLYDAFEVSALASSSHLARMRRVVYDDDAFLAAALLGGAHVSPQKDHSKRSPQKVVAATNPTQTPEEVQADDEDIPEDEEENGTHSNVSDLFCW